MSTWRQARAIALLPGMVTVLVPAGLLVVTDTNPGWGISGAPSALPVLVGVSLILAGFALWLWTVRLFTRVGRGTLAPWDPTQRLVVRGPYRHVRNPMITAVLAALAGEAALFGSLPLLLWCLAFFALNHAFFCLREEPDLERRFGNEYLDYKRHVPRWLPRRTAWIPAGREPQAKGGVRDLPGDQAGGDPDGC